tara:strand:+ start:4027 stop:5139 length:1113 start_codon:yes stop_codon:yes gene_type:complete
MQIKSRELTLQDKLNQKVVRSRIAELIENNGKSVSPWVIELDPTTACNLACHDCISANLLNQGGFDRDRIKDMAREFKDFGIKAVVLIGGGEPMAHPEFGTLVDYFYECGIHVGVTSNGTLIRKNLDSLAKRTKWVRISVDAGSPEIFQKYRPHRSGKSQFNSVIEQMKELSEIKTGKLGYSFLVLSMNSEDNEPETNAIDIQNAANIAKDIGCDYFEVKPSFDMMHFLNTQSEYVNNTVDEQLKNIKKLEDDKFVIISPYTLKESLTGNSNQTKLYKRCLTAEMRTVVTPSGTYVCPYHRGNLNMKIGDSNKDSIKEIWNSKKRKQVMDKLDPTKHCTFHCIRHNSNLVLEKYLEGDQFEVVDDYDLFI